MRILPIKSNYYQNRCGQYNNTTTKSFYTNTNLNFNPNSMYSTQAVSFGNVAKCTDDLVQTKRREFDYNGLANFLYNGCNHDKVRHPNPNVLTGPLDIRPLDAPIYEPYYKILRAINNGAPKHEIAELEASAQQFYTKLHNEFGLDSIVSLAHHDTPEEVEFFKKFGIDYLGFPLDDHSVFMYKDSKRVGLQEDFIKGLGKFLKLLREGNVIMGCFEGRDRTERGMYLMLLDNPKEEVSAEFVFARKFNEHSNSLFLRIINSKLTDELRKKYNLPAKKHSILPSTDWSMVCPCSYAINKTWIGFKTLDGCPGTGYAEVEKSARNYSIKWANGEES